MIKFVLDVGVGYKIWQYLTDNGFDATLITAINPSMSDVDILLIAENEARMVITMDKDFGESIIQAKRIKVFYCSVLKMQQVKKKRQLCSLLWRILKTKSKVNFVFSKMDDFGFDNYPSVFYGKKP